MIRNPRRFSYSRSIHPQQRFSTTSTINGRDDNEMVLIMNETATALLDQLTTENQAAFFSGNNRMIRPNQTFIELEYDYLSPDSLSAVRAFPFLKRKKGKQYLIQWWKAAKKWGLLSDKLLETEFRFKKYLNSLHAQKQQRHAENHSIKSTTVDSSLEERRKDTVDSAYEEEFLSLIIEELTDISRQHIARVIVIGDIHGCIEEFCELLRKVNYLPGDQVVLLGDLVAKGPYSADTVQLAMDISALAVRGNHDQETLRQAFAYQTYMKNETKTLPKHARIARSLTREQIKWLANLPYFIRSKDLGAIFVHAGMEEGVNLENQLPSVMLSIRSLVKGKRESRKPSSICYLQHPWAPSWKGPLKLYFGHDSARGFQQYSHAVGIDTGCVYGGNLTAILLPNEEIVQVPALKAYLTNPKSARITTASTNSRSTKGISSETICSV